MPRKKLYRYIRDNKKNKFLNYYAECGNICRAADKMDLTRQTHYYWMRTDSDYRRVFEQQVEPMVTGMLEDECLRRATGYQEPVFYQGQQCGEITRYSDTCLLTLLRARNPEKYADRSKVENITDMGAVISWEDDDEPDEITAETTTETTEEGAES